MRVERLKEEFPLELDVWAYDLRPGTPPEGIPREEVYRGGRYTPGYFDQLRQVAQECGIQMTTPKVVASTGKAHEATEFAKDGGKLPQFHRAVFRAYWEDGDNIGEAEVLCRLAQECGLDAQELRQALADGRYTQRVEEQMRWSRQVGIGGIPTFVFNDTFALVGAQEYDVFKNVAQRLLSGEIKA